MVKLDVCLIKFTSCIIPIYTYQKFICIYIVFQTFSRISTTVIHTYNETSTDTESSEVNVHHIVNYIQYNKA